MFEWLENIWNGIKGFFGFFESVLQYIQLGFRMLGDILSYPVTFVQNFGQYVPAWVLPMFFSALLVTGVSLIVGRRDK